jgi:hypothetical protein
VNLRTWQLTPGAIYPKLSHDRKVQAAQQTFTEARRALYLILAESPTPGQEVSWQ